MYRQTIAPGSLAAVLAAFCVLSPAPATTAADASSGLLLDQPRCCLPAPAGKRIAPGVEGPAAGIGADGRAAGAGTRLAQGAKAPSEAPSEPAEEPPTATEMPREAEKIPGTPAADAGDSFEGSPKPAGPDLSISEERELISRGWE